jgi:hypothetical protein
VVRGYSNYLHCGGLTFWDGGLGVVPGPVGGGFFFNAGGASSIGAVVDGRKRAREGDAGDRSGRPRNPPPDTYLCRRCNVKGHWLDDCPESSRPFDGAAGRGNVPARSAVGTVIFFS